MKLAVVIITYHRVRDAQSLMYAIRTQWAEQSVLRDTTIFHVFNGKPEWYPRKSFEDVLLRTHNDGHMTGASHMIDVGIDAVLKSDTSYDVILVCSSDVFFFLPAKLAHIVSLMEKPTHDVVTSRWFHPWAFSTEFFMIRPSLARKIFPLRLKDHLRTHRFMKARSAVLSSWPILEELFFQRVTTTLNRLYQHRWREHLMFIPGREYVFVHNRFESVSLGYSSFHHQNTKIKLLRSTEHAAQREKLLSFWK